MAGGQRHPSARRQKQHGGTFALHHRAASFGQPDHRPVAGRELDPAGRDQTAHQPQQPLLTALAEDAEGRRLVEAGSQETIVVNAPHELGGCRHAEPAVDPATPLSALRTMSAASSASWPGRDSPSASTRRRFRSRPAFPLVAEVPENRVVAAGSALRPPEQFEEQVPLVLERLGGRPFRGLQQAPANRHVAGRHQEQSPRRLAVASRAADLLVVGLDGSGGER